MILALKATEMKKVEFANSAEPHEVAHNEPPRVVLRCLPSSL